MSARVPTAPPNTSHDTPATEHWSGELLTLVLATIPASLAYFVGWTYLYHYLRQFGIEIAELDLGLETVLVYSVPPLRAIMLTHATLLCIVLVVLLVLAARPRWLPVGLRTSARRFIPRLSSVSGGMLALVLLIGLTISLNPLVRGVAAERVLDTWTTRGIAIQAAVKVDEKDRWQPLKDYQMCQQRRALKLVIADKAAYFMLCPGEINPRSGQLFEVRRDDSVLASARLVDRPAEAKEQRP